MEMDHIFWNNKSFWVYSLTELFYDCYLNMMIGKFIITNLVHILKKFDGASSLKLLIVHDCGWEMEMVFV